MPPRATPLFLANFLAFAGIALLLSPDVRAFGAIDPFDSAAATPPRPALTSQGRSDNASPCQPPRGDSTVGITEAVDLALCNNPLTREVWANARAQAALTGVAQAAYLPNLDGKATLGRVSVNADENQQRSAALTLSWLLFDFGARAANLENARQLLEAASATLDATVQSVFLGALQSYYGAQASAAALGAAQESEKASRESFAAAEARYKVGAGTPADRLQAQTAWSQATLNRIRAEGERRNSLGTLANVMGLAANQPLLLAGIAEARPDAAFEKDIDALIEEARQRRPDLKSAEAQFRAAQSNVSFTRNAGLPTLSLGAGPSWSETGNVSSHANSIGLTLSLPLFSGFSTTYKVRNAEAQAEARAAQRDRIRLQVALDVWKAYQSLTTANQSIRTTIDLLNSAEQSERVALGRYKAGVGTILEVLNAQTALASARLQRVQATLDWHVYRATLAQAIGALDSGLLQTQAPGKQ